MTLALLLLLVWTVLHGANYFWRHRKPKPLLPLPSFARPRETGHTQVVLDKLHARIQTVAWNERHDALSKSLRPGTRLGFSLQIFYNAGVVAGVLGSAVSLGLLLWNFGHALAPWVHNTLATATQPALLAKRGLDETDSVVIKPIIPGITTPLGHLPAILLGVFVSQIVHELGHAVSAALDAIPLVSAGASFTVAIPAAFVTFPTTAMEALQPWARSRIIAAGPFHNLVFWLFLVTMDRVGNPLLTRLLYQDASNVGRVVLNIDEDSELWNHIAPGSLITQIDDVSLASPEDLWTSYLTSSSLPVSTRGWCADRVDFTTNSRSCCKSSSSSLLSCFSSIVAHESGCLDAISILASNEHRCETDDNCSPQMQCVLPHETAHLVRLTAHTNAGDQIILWNGPKNEIYEQIEVGTSIPRILPFWIHRQTGLFWTYLKLATLSLYLFNLLPLPHLDGTQFMLALLDMLFPEGLPSEEYDIDALEAGSGARSGAGTDTQRRRGPWKGRLARRIPIATCCIFVLCVLLTLVNMR